MATNQEIAARAQELYVAYYGRPADPDGLDFWTGQFTRTDDVSRALASFGASAEYRAIVTAANNNRDVLINQLYQYMFNRDADAEGLMFYRGQLERGEATLASIALDIANGARNDDRAILDNKIEVANAFTDRVEREDAPYTRANIRSARELLEPVDETEASVTSAQASIRALVDGLNGVIELTEDNPTANYSAYSVPVTVTLNGDEDETEFAVTGSAFGDTFILEEYLRANISGGGGIDTVDFSEAEGDYTINLGIGTFSADIDDDNLPDFSGTLGSIESVIGSDQVDRIHGGDGNERIDGGGGADILRGGAGDDTFVYADDSDLPATEIVEGQTGVNVIEFTGNAIDLTAINSKNVDVQSLLLSNLGGSSAVTLELDDTNGFGPNDFRLITGSDTVDTLRIGGDADFSNTEVNGIEIFSVSADNLKVQANTLDDVVTLLGPDNAGSTITATASGVYDLSGTSISGWNLLAGTARQAGEIWVLNQAQIDSLLDSKDTRLFGDGMVDASMVVAGTRIAHDALRASGSLDLTRVTTDAAGATAGLNVYEINFASNASIEINDDQLKGGLKLITGTNTGETLIINTNDDDVDFSTDKIGLSELDALRFVKDGRAASAKVTIGEAGFRGISDVTGTSSELTISAAAGKSVDLVDSDVTSWSTLSFDKANTIKLDQPVLNQFEDDFGDGVTGELTLEMGETTLNLSKVDFDDKVTTVTVTGTTSADTVTGFSAEDNLALKGVYNLGMGNDRFIGTDKPADFTGTVTVNGGDGNDVITLGERGGGTQIVDGGKGDDRITAGGSSDKLTGGDGADRFTVAMNIIGVEVTDFDGVGADNQDDEYRLDFNVSSKTEFYDLVNRNRLPVLTTNATADGGVAGVRELVSPGRALGLGTGALPSQTAGDAANALTKTTAAIAFLNALTNKEDFYDSEFVLFANADDKLIAFVVTAIEGKEDSITAEEISMVTIGELGGGTGVIGESDLILI